MDQWKDYFLLGRLEMIQRHYAMDFIKTKLQRNKQISVSLHILYDIYCIWVGEQQYEEVVKPISITEFKELILFRFDFSPESKEYPLRSLV